MIYIAGDKHGYQAISFVEEYLKLKHIEYENLGAKSADEEMKLEHMIPPVANKVRENKGNKAILSCGTGIGVEVGANKFAGVRACLATNSEIAQWSVQYDNCNVLCLVGWNAERDRVFKILDAWFGTQYDGDQGRLEMMKIFDTWH